MPHSLHEKHHSLPLGASDSFLMFPPTTYNTLMEMVASL